MMSIFDRYRYLIRTRFRKVVLSKDMETFLLISMGAVIGANLRYWIGVWAASRLGTSFPYGNLIINLTGSFILGFFMTLAVDRLLLDPRWRIFFAVGFLGSYTTFSSYTFESMSLILDNQWLTGLFNLFGSAFLGGVAVFLGILLARAI
jgi:CrcB protein